MSISPTDPQDPMRLIRELQERAEQLQEQSRQITAAMSEAAVTVSNQFVELTVSPGGAIERLEFTDAATSAAQTQVASSIKQLYAEAEIQAASRTSAAMAAAGLAPAVTASLPADVAEQIERNR